MLLFYDMVKVTWYTIREATLLFSDVPPIQWGPTLEGKGANSFFF